MIRKSHLPKTVAALPRQRLAEVVTLPPWPDHAKIADCLFRRGGLTAEQAAAHHIASLSRAEAEEYGLDPFHLVAEEGVLSVADLRAIARMVWGEGEARQ